MYIPEHFKMNSERKIQKMIAANPLAHIFYQHEQGLELESIPTYVDWERGDQGCIEGHISKQNPLAAQNGQRVLAAYQGRSFYVSPSLYERKKIDGMVVPTWNFETIQVNGVFELMQDGAWLLDHLERMTAMREMGLEQPWKVSDAPVEFISRVKEGIVGFQIRISQIQAKEKMSQNRPSKDIARILKSQKKGL